MRGPARGDKRERGAVAVEAALITPVLFLIVFGIVEMSLLMRDVVSVSSATHVGTRMAATGARDGPGTCSPSPCTPPTAPKLAQTAADAIQKAGSAMPQDQINWIRVYRANTQGYPMPNGNTTATCGTDCVEYKWNDAQNKFVYAGGSWISTSINACVNDPNRMSVGVIMNANHPFITGIFGDGMTIQERSVVQFEPLANDECKPGLPNSHP